MGKIIDFQIHKKQCRLNKQRLEMLIALMCVLILFFTWIDIELFLLQAIVVPAIFTKSVYGCCIGGVVLLEVLFLSIVGYKLYGLVYTKINGWKRKHK